MLARLGRFSAQQAARPYTVRYSSHTSRGPFPFPDRLPLLLLTDHVPDGRVLPASQQFLDLLYRAESLVLSQVLPFLAQCLRKVVIDLCHVFSNALRAELPNIGLHADTVVCMLLEEGKPKLDRFRVAVPDLNEAADCNSLEVLLGFLEDETAPWHGPTLGDARKWHRAKCREIQVVRCSKGKVGKELEVPEGVGPQLQVARGDAVFGLAPEGLQVQSLNTPRETNSFGWFLRLGGRGATRSRRGGSGRGR